MNIAEARLDIEAVYTAIDRKRRQLRLTRKEVAEALGVTPPSITMWGQGQGMSADKALRACLWLDADIKDFAVQQAAE